MEFKEFVKLIGFEHIIDDNHNEELQKMCLISYFMDSDNLNLFIETFNYGYIDFSTPNRIINHCIVISIYYKKYDFLCYLVELGVKFDKKDNKNWWHEERYRVEYNKLKEKHLKLKML